MKDLLPTLSKGALISQLFAGYLAYYLLLHDNCLNCSISNLIHHAHNLSMHAHLMLLGLLPIYIAVVIFGSAMLGAILGRHLDEQIIQPLSQKRSKATY
jgi:hypothetical protein